jgi:hypothetical protein
MSRRAGFFKPRVFRWRSRVTESSPHRDPWRYPALALWIAFFLVGMAPEEIFYWLRDLSVVLPQHALVNSHHLLTLAMACYVGLFAYHRCTDVGMPLRDAQDRGLQTTIIGLIAFISVDFRLLFSAYSDSFLQYRFVLYFVGFSKLLAWWSLMTIFIRYYGFDDDYAFAGIPSLFPSSMFGNKRKSEKSQHESVSCVPAPPAVNEENPAKETPQDNQD